jgi:oligoendopeptidase F
VIATLLLCGFVAEMAYGQDGFVAIPPEQTARYHIDFARNFFPSPEVEKADRAAVYTSLKELEALKGKIANSANNLERALQSYDRVRIAFGRHYAYLYLRYAVNTKDEASLADSSTLDADVTSRTAFVRQELLQIDAKTLGALVVQAPALKKYLFYIEDIRRYQPHTLSLKEEELLSATSPINSEWQSDLYGKLMARTPQGTAHSREEAFKKRYEGLASQRDLYAFTLMRLVTARNQLARLRHYEDAPSEIYFGRYSSKVEVN